MAEYTTAEIVEALRCCGSANCRGCPCLNQSVDECLRMCTVAANQIESLLRENATLNYAMNRLGKFGQLFVDYNGCPRGSVGRMGAESLDEEALSMPEIIDVDGGKWIPVHADVLRELCEQSKSRWISVKERLPNGWIMVDETTNYREPEEYIVLIDGAYGPTTAYCIDGKFVPLCTIEGCGTPKCIGYADKVTHWMPMPEPQKEG